MLDDFLTRAAIAGVGMALVTGPLGCFVIWRRMSYFGDMLAHAALLGVALAVLLEINITLAVFVLAVAVSLAVLALQARALLSSDTVLGLLSHGALAVGLVTLSFMTWVRMDLMGLLFGDLLAVSRTDIAVIFGGGAIVLFLLWWYWRPLFAVTVNRDIAAAEGFEASRYDALLLVLLAAVVAVSIKIVGAILVTAMLIIPAGAARRWSPDPQFMVVAAACIGSVAALAGLFGSLQWNTPSGPSIVVAALIIFMLGLMLPVRSRG